MDRERLRHPFYGKKRLRHHLIHLDEEEVFTELSESDKMLRRNDLSRIGLERVKRLMDKAGIEAIYKKPNTSGIRAGFKSDYPHLLKGLVSDHSNQVWATDVTYLPVCGGYLYLVAIIDLFSRYVVNWRLSNTLDARFRIYAVEEAFEQYGRQEIFISDQGSQFTSQEYSNLLSSNKVKISLEGKADA
jgi:putative transposase